LGIDALTIKLVPQSSLRKTDSSARFSLEDTLRSVESSIRSLNNLEAQLNHGNDTNPGFVVVSQSFFFIYINETYSTSNLLGFYLYAFMGQKYFVSIGEYAISIALNVAAYCMLGLSLSSRGLRLTSVLSTWRLFALCTITVTIAETAGG
jgi:hypothetical protein